MARRIKRFFVFLFFSLFFSLLSWRISTSVKPDKKNSILTENKKQKEIFLTFNSAHAEESGDPYDCGEADD